MSWFLDEGDDVFDSRVSPRHPLADPALVDDFLQQGDAWMPAGGGYVSVEDMEPAHARATAAFVLNRATQIAIVLSCAGVADAWWAADLLAVRKYLVDTPLVKALIQRGKVQLEASPPWEFVKRTATRASMPAR